MGYTEVRECKVCTALIADDRAYGRKASRRDANVCECCDERRSDLDTIDLDHDMGLRDLSDPFGPREFSGR